jgi:Cu/Ag efflux protein CusF
MLDRVKSGDKVKFAAEMVKKEAVVTRIEVVK